MIVLSQHENYFPLLPQSWRLVVLEQMAVSDVTDVVVVVMVVVPVVNATKKRNWGSLRDIKPG